MKAIIGQAYNLPWWKICCMSDEQVKQHNSKFLQEIEMHEPHDEHVKAYDINHFKNRKRTKPVTTLKGLKMKDDNLSDTQQQHIKFGYCPKCDREHAWNIDCSVGIRPEDEKALKATYKYESVLARNIWNEAIETAACQVDGGENAYNIRKLKK